MTQQIKTSANLMCRYGNGLQLINRCIPTIIFQWFYVILIISWSLESWKSFFKHQYQLDFSSSLFVRILNVASHCCISFYSLGFALLVEQIKTFEDVSRDQVMNQLMKNIIARLTDNKKHDVSALLKSPGVKHRDWIPSDFRGHRSRLFPLILNQQRVAP